MMSKCMSFADLEVPHFNIPDLLFKEDVFEITDRCLG